MALQTSVTCPSIPALPFLPKISPIKTRSTISTLAFPSKISPIQTRLLIAAKPALKPLMPTSTRGHCGGICCCFKNIDIPKNSVLEKDKDLNWRILQRWDVPWSWQTISLTSLACGLSTSLHVQVRAATLHYTGIKVKELGLDEMALLSFFNEGIATIVFLWVLYSLTKLSSPLPDDIYRYDQRDPFDLKKGWLLWAGVGLGALLATIGVTTVALSFFVSKPQQKEIGALADLLPFIGSSSISTACVMGMTSVLGPILEEIAYRGFFMVALTKWLPTPLAVLISASVFAAAHGTPTLFPMLFVGGAVMGFFYAQTRNLLTPITIHAFWNATVTLFVTFLKLQGYDLKEYLQAY